MDIKEHPSLPNTAAVTVENSTEASLLANSLVRPSLMNMVAFMLVDHKPFNQLMNEAVTNQGHSEVAMTHRQLRVAHKGLVARLPKRSRDSEMSLELNRSVIGMTGKISNFFESTKER